LRPLTLACSLLAATGCEAFVHAPDTELLVEVMSVEHRDADSQAAGSTTLHEVARCDASAFAPEWSVQVDGEAALAVGWNPGSELIVGTTDGRVEVIPFGVDGPARSAHTLRVPGLSALATAPRVALTGDQTGRVQLWDVASGALIGAVGLGNDPVVAVALSETSQRAAAVAQDGAVVVWTTETGHGRSAYSALDTVVTIALVGDYVALGGSVDGRAALELRDVSSLSRADVSWVGAEGVDGAITSILPTSSGLLALGVAGDRGTLLTLSERDGWAVSGERTWSEAEPVQAVALPDGARAVVLDSEGALRFLGLDDLRERDVVETSEGMGFGYDPLRGTFAIAQPSGALAGFGC